MLSGSLLIPAHAAESTVNYSNIYESSGTGTDPLYLAPVTTGDTLNFSPTFTAFADGSSGNAAEMTTGRVSFDVQAVSGNAINGLDFLERGNYSLLSFGNIALADVSANLFIEVLEVDGATLPFPANDDIEMTFNPASDGQFQHNTFGVSSGSWTGNTGFDLDALLVSNGIAFLHGATRIHVELDNTLLSMAQTDAQAHIAIQDLQVISSTTSYIIPEPSSQFLLGGMGAVILILRRRFTK
jgi:hypothetical protein